MARTGQIQERDVLNILRIVNGVFELPEDLEIRSEYLLREVCHFFRARSGMVALLNPKVEEKEAIMQYGVAGGFLDESTRALYQRYAAEAHLRDVMLTQIIKRRELTGVFSRGAEVSDRTWYNSVHFNEMRIPLGIDEPLYCFWSVPNSPILAGIGFNRELRAQRFGARELRLARIFHEALIPYYRFLYDSKQDLFHPRLPPRVQQVYQLLKTGLSEKQIAYKLGLSHHTVHGYIKHIYSSFNVHSRAELLAENKLSRDVVRNRPGTG